MDPPRYEGFESKAGVWWMQLVFGLYILIINQQHYSNSTGTNKLRFRLRSAFRLQLATDDSTAAELQGRACQCHHRESRGEILARWCKQDPKVSRGNNSMKEPNWLSSNCCFISLRVQLPPTLEHCYTPNTQLERLLPWSTNIQQRYSKDTLDRWQLIFAWRPKISLVNCSDYYY